MCRQWSEILCRLQVECQQEPGQQGELTLTLQQQTVTSDTEVRLKLRESSCTQTDYEYIKFHVYILLLKREQHSKELPNKNDAFNSFPFCVVGDEFNCCSVCWHDNILLQNTPSCVLDGTWLDTTCRRFRFIRASVLLIVCLSVCVSSLRVTAFVSTCQNSSIGGWWITWREPPSFSPPLLPLSTCSPQWPSLSLRPPSPSLTAIWWIPPSPRCLSASSPWWRIKPYVLDSTNIVTEKKDQTFCSSFN